MKEIESAVLEKHGIEDWFEPMIQSKLPFPDNQKSNAGTDALVFEIMPVKKKPFDCEIDKESLL